jgi:hypothetical protein
VTLEPRVLPSVALPVATAGANLGRADIVVSGLDQAGPSFELRLFLNNPRADARTEPAPDTGYAGSVYVYGHGRAPEETGARSVPHPRIPMTRYVMATEAIRAAVAKGPAATITLVPVPFQTSAPEIDLDDVKVTVLVRE